jgi:hypothetical protein
MKMKRAFVVVVILSAIGFFSCETKTERKETPISFQLKTFRAESTGGCKADTLPCAYYEVTYPEFSGLDSGTANIIKREIDASVSMGNPEATGQTMEQIGKGFINDYEEFKTEIPEGVGGWHYTAKVEVEVQTDSLLSLSVNDEYYTGGAHGGSGVYFINVNPRTGKKFTLDNLLKPGYQEPLREAGNRIFRQVRTLADTASLIENAFEFPEDKFELNQNYGFKQEGIVFFYNSYEIAPYAAGPTEVLIPYEELKAWMR